ncbi:MAG: tRNA (N(6)-L-threonylcarbamoyladenosine(37)-C(2))-methylthiotransferase MtaB [Chloroflexota bacterium]|nr:tRNA (N(6)-L-threonylcarbamoyladenosine(37)-C(2))-methylthiotransferase MtaB [Chloroflexota bacterium]
MESLGCKLNQAEQEELSRQFVRAGWRSAVSPSQADVYVLNTCTVTHVADRKVRQKIRWVRRNNPKAQIIAIGCYAHQAPERLLAAGADLVLDNNNKVNLPEMLDVENAVPSPMSAPINPIIPKGRTRSLVEIQSGCDHNCSFCIVPSTRGHSRSVPFDHVITSVRERVNEGYKEVVLTGTEIGAYSSEGQGILDLIKAILGKTNVQRLRLSSLQPHELTPELLDLWTTNRLCNHLHISLQSGSDSVLRRMKRSYDTATFHNTVLTARKAISDLAITTDVIIGFPGEIDAEFEESFRFCQDIEFSSIHAFPFSARPGTSAETMRPQVKEDIKRDRIRRMLHLSECMSHRFRERFLGQVLHVLWEKESSSGTWNGLTTNGLRVFLVDHCKNGGHSLSNRILPVRIVGTSAKGLCGHLINNI